MWYVAYSADCAAIIDTCAQYRVKLMVAYRLHFDLANLRAVELANGGKLGDLRVFASTFSMQVKPGNVRLQREQGLTVVLVSHLLGSVADAAQSIAIIASGKLDVGPREEMLTAEHLTRLYGVEVHVHTVDGKTSITIVNGTGAADAA